MDENEVKNVCAAAMLDYETALPGSLTVMEEMMEAVVQSGLCIGTAPVPCSGRPLREDRAETRFTREEMLAGTPCRRGDFAVVPQIIK